jgi:transcriptional regulator with XRE-family HTH domain
MVAAVSDDAASKIVSELSKRLAQEREAAGVSKKSLASTAGFDRSTARYIENPEDNPTLLNLIRYGLALNLDVGQILSECLKEHLGAKPLKKRPPKKS